MTSPPSVRTIEGLNFKSSATSLEAIRRRATSDLYFFAKGVLGYDWLVPHIHLPICRELEDCETRRRVIVLPRDWLKTTLCTVSYSIWRSIRNPNIRTLLTQNSATNAMKKLGIIRGQWENNQLLKALFPELLPTSKSSWRADSACLTRSKDYPESTYEAAGTNTKVVSRHYDLIIEDDTVAPDLDELGVEAFAPSTEDVERAIGWHRTNVLPLLNDVGTGDVLVVGTRWYDQDLIRWIIDNEPQYKVISRACREDAEGRPSPKGAIVYPERFNEKVLLELERSMGPYLYNCLYMNTPVRSEDMLFKPDWIQYYESAPNPAYADTFTTLDVATDPTLAKGKDLDYSVVMTCAKEMNTGYIFVLEYTRLRGNPGEVASELLRHVVTYRPSVVGYEDVAYQRSIEYWLRELMRQQNIFFLLEPIPHASKGKAPRIPGLQPLFAARAVFLRSHMKELESELLSYPLGRHDDIIDALSMQLHFWRMTRRRGVYQPPPDDNPLSFVRAKKEIEARRRGKLLTSVVNDPSHMTRELPGGIQRTYA